ncbi:MAG: hypothetical protein AB4352_15485 [Hormoscilla sp.]
MMNASLSLETVIEYIESLSPKDRALLFDQLHRRRLKKPQQTAATTQPQHPLLMVPATLTNNPLFDEVLGYMQEYRRELDATREAYYRELDAETKVK